MLKYMDWEFQFLNWIQNNLRSETMDKIMPIITKFGDGGIFWIAVTLLTPRENAETLRKFDEKIHANLRELPIGILCMVVGCLAVWSCLFGCGYLIYGVGGIANGYALGGGLLAVSAVATFVLMKLVGKAKLS